MNTFSANFRTVLVISDMRDLSSLFDLCFCLVFAHGFEVGMPPLEKGIVINFHAPIRI